MASVAEAGPRFGCTVSRRVGNAVVRNRVKRLLRTVFRRIRSELPPVDFVVVAQPQAAELAREGVDTISAEIVPAMEEAGRRALSGRGKRARRRTVGMEKK